MTDDPAPQNRRITGQFAPGVSGNPGGRPRRDRRTQEILNEVNEPVLLAAVKSALGGDVSAQRLVLDRSAPVPKGSTAPIKLGPLTSAADCVGAMGRISAGLEEGRLDTAMGAQLTGMVTAAVKVLEVCDQEARLQEVERQLREQRR